MIAASASATRAGTAPTARARHLAWPWSRVRLAAWDVQFERTAALLTPREGTPLHLHLGWVLPHGICARACAGLHVSGTRPWLAETVVVSPEAAAASAAGASMARGSGAMPLHGAARRPLIYVYDLPAAYNSRMLQYRNDR